MKLGQSSNGGEITDRVAQLEGVSTKRIQILLGTILVGFAMVLLLDYAIDRVIENLNRQLQNEQSRLLIGEFINGDLSHLRAKAHQLLAARNEKSRQLIFRQLQVVRGQIEEGLDVLERGGELRRVTWLNLEGKESMTRVIRYRAESTRRHYVLEAIELRPQLLKVEAKAATILEHLRIRDHLSAELPGAEQEGRLGASVGAEQRAAVEKVKSTIQLMSPLFTRMEENSNRLFYLAQQNVEAIREEIREKAHWYFVLEVLLSILIIISVLFFGRRLLRQAASANRLLRETTQDLMAQKAETERHAEELGHSRAILAQAQQIARLGSWELDLSQRDLRACRILFSDEMYRILEIDPARFDGTFATVIDLCHPEDRDGVVSSLVASSSDGSKHDLEHRLLFSDGRIKYVSVQAESSFDENGVALRSNGTIQDITARTLAAQALQESEERNRLLLDTAPSGIYGVDTEGRPTFVNRMALTMLGFEADELLGKVVHNLVHHTRNDGTPFPREECPSCTALINQRSHVVSSERYWRKDGSSFPVEYRITPLIKNGKSTGAVVVFHDITERIEAERAQREAKEAAEAANRAKSEFLANMSHEIRTPMNGVIGMTNLLLDSALDSEQQSYALTIKRSADSLLGVINDILDFSKIEAGRLELEPADFDMGLLLASFAHTLAFRAQDKGLEFICPTNPVLHQWYYADSGRIRQILTNLVGNAIKFTERGEISVGFEVLQRHETWERVRFEVIDSGIGLDAGQQERLFDRFTQADSSTTRHYGGTGLGLAISKQLVEIMRGQIGVESRLGEGSRFWFTLELPLGTPQPRSDRPLPDLSAEKVLVVDDNATSRETLGQVLNNWKIRSQLVANGPDALQQLYLAALQGHPYTIALIDAEMPEMDGEQLGRLIQSDEKLATTKRVLLAPQGRRGERRMRQRADFDAYLSKPIDQSELYNLLLKITGVTSDEMLQRGQPLSEGREQFNARILIAEDNATNQAVARGLLEKMGIQVDCVENGEEAIAALGRERYDLVFMDCQMPVLDGYQATEKIRDRASDIRDHSIPVVAMTASAMQGDREKCLASGMDDHLTKPIDPSKVREALAHWLPPHCRADSVIVGEEAVTASGLEADQEMEAPIFDYDGLLERMMEDSELVAMVASAFIEDMSQQIDQLKQAVADQDSARVGALAHKIKGAAANIGGMQLSQQAKALEIAGKAGALPPLGDALQAIDRHFEALRVAIGEKI